MSQELNLQDIKEAAELIKDKIYRTPLIYNEFFSQLTGNKIFLKLENLQKTGAFKIRGNLNKIFHLSREEKSKGVIGASSGNHALGLALASSLVKIKSTVVMPETTPKNKIEKAKRYGAKVIIFGEGYDEAYAKTICLQKEIGAVLIPSFDDPRIIAGQGTIALEILEQISDVDTIIAPIGGGGLISGLLIAIKSMNSHIKVIGVQSEGAPSMYQSWKKGRICQLKNIKTIAEGVAVKRPGSLNFSIVNKLVDDIVTVKEDEITNTIGLFLKEAKIIVEGAGAVSLASLIYNKVKIKGEKVACIVSGGNIDWESLKEIIDGKLYYGTNGNRTCFY
mgnify:CR=1 FL=1